MGIYAIYPSYKNYPPRGSETPRAVSQPVRGNGSRMRIGRVEHPCGGQGGKSLHRLDDECQIGVELRSTSSALTVALQSRLAQDSLDGFVVDTEMGGLLARALSYLVESIVNSEGFTIRGSNCGLVKEASLYGTSSFG